MPLQDRRKPHKLPKEPPGCLLKVKDTEDIPPDLLLYLLSVIQRIGKEMSK